jgi:beta-glucanase (GH16 family)
MRLKLPTILILLTIITLPSIAQTCWTQVWGDEFNGTSLNTADWNYETGTGCPGNCGWGNGESEYYTKNTSNVSVSGGNLNIVGKYSANYAGSGYNFTSGKINTRYKQYFKYGRFEASMKLPAGTGTWPAFWMLSESNIYGGWPTSGEIDIMENRGDQTTTVGGTVHYGNSYPNNKHDGSPFTLSSGNFTNAFHLFAVEWEPNEIRWYVDGTLYKTITKSPNNLNPPSNNAVTWPWDQDFYIIINLALGGNYTGSPSDAAISGGSTSWTTTMLVDYVRVYTDFAGGNETGNISGESSIMPNESNVVYSVPVTSGATYNWTVTSGTLVSGQGTNAIVVNWANTSGNVSVTKTVGCGNVSYTLPVTIMANCGTMLEDFENMNSATYGQIDGQFTQKIANPGSSSVNSSPSCAKYIRNAAQQYDVLIVLNPNIGNADLIKNSSKHLMMDVYSNAAGRNVQITLESTSTNSGAYPAGRHSTYSATTTKTNQWETLTFNWIATPDATVPGTSVDQLTTLFKTNTYTGDTYYYDNLLLSGACPSVPVSTATTEATYNNSVSIFPNPAGENANIKLNNLVEEGLVKIQIMESTGKIISETEYPSSSGNEFSIPVSTLNAGYYLIRIMNGDYSNVKGFFKK